MLVLRSRHLFFMRSIINMNGSLCLLCNAFCCCLFVFFFYLFECICLIMCVHHNIKILFLNVMCAFDLFNVCVCFYSFDIVRCSCFFFICYCAFVFVMRCFRFMFILYKLCLSINITCRLRCVLLRLFCSCSCVL